MISVRYSDIHKKLYGEDVNIYSEYGSCFVDLFRLNDPQRQSEGPRIESKAHPTSQGLQNTYLSQNIGPTYILSYTILNNILNRSLYEQITASDICVLAGTISAEIATLLLVQSEARKTN